MGRGGKRVASPPSITTKKESTSSNNTKPPPAQPLNNNPANLNEPSATNPSDSEQASEKSFVDSNTSDTLSDSGSNSITEDSGSTPTKTLDKTPKIPPIILQGSSWRKIAGKLMSSIPSDSLQAKTFGKDEIKLQCCDIELFRITQKYLTQTKTEFHTFSLPDERSLKFVIKGLLRDISENEVFEELTNLGYEVTNVRQFGKPNLKLPIHMVTLKNTPHSKNIFNIDNLLYISVKVERYKSNSPAQCFNCQRFGHSSSHCGFSPRCVKCAGPHQTKQCTKTPEEDPKCSNCGGDHTANYKKCPTILKEIETRQPKRKLLSEKIFTSSQAYTSKPITPDIPLSTSHSDPLRSNKLSYAKATQNQPSYPIKLHSIAEQLQNLLSNIANGSTDIKDALITTIMAILPLILNHHG